MKNREYYKDKIHEIACAHDIFAISKKTGKMVKCADVECCDCLFDCTLEDLSNCYTCKERAVNWLEREHVESVLTDEEKQYLETVIRPFKDRAIDVTKYKLSDNYAWLYIDVEGVTEATFDGFSLPAFRKDDAYLDMEYDKKYTLEELGLFEDE